MKFCNGAPDGSDTGKIRNRFGSFQPILKNEASPVRSRNPAIAILKPNGRRRRKIMESQPVEHIEFELDGSEVMIEAIAKQENSRFCFQPVVGVGVAGGEPPATHHRGRAFNAAGSMRFHIVLSILSQIIPNRPGRK